MCGIAGVTGRRADVETIRRMIAAMRSRGPDDEGRWESPESGAALGNCRLAIIDLSPAGRMPMPDAEGRCRITYNGEIYNFRELRSELERHGHAFRSQTDTEVVLAAYLRWGPDCLDRLTGMFAFALHDFRDPNDPRLFLARDRLGIKPLYWARTEDGIVFASEVKGMLASGLVAPVLDRQAAWDYLTLGSVPGPRTIVRGVRSLLPGHAMLIRGTEIHRWQYWASTPRPTAALAMPEAAAGLRELLEEVVRQHLVADVPVGAFLSGGLDSAGIVALASRAASHPLRTFTVAFGTGPEAQAELSHARDVATACGADHSEEVVSGPDVAGEFDAIIDAMDQPTTDGVNSYYVSRAARQAVTVALSGLGADEAFAGYPHFVRLRQAAARLPHGNGALRRAGAVMERLAPRRLSSTLRFAAAAEPGRHSQLREVFTPSEKRRLCRRDALPQGLARTEEGVDIPTLSASDPVTAASAVEIGGYLANTLLRDADAMSMAHSLEVRVPYIDHRIVEIALSLPGNFKLEGRKGKAILRYALANLVPEGSLIRPKSYFSIPLEEWVAGPLLPRVRASLRSSSANRLFRPEPVRRLEDLAAHRRGTRAWAAAVLAAWMETHEVSP